ncbi:MULTISPECIES: hypothetical protein [unclassified Streptomyces]|uniref:hypothetical protein n=1 Tax=unclassified Streptomyces TaxID=2593676 RepID=UPI002362C3B8|nr:hypothetical protein [Streptomyces sp. MMBL 11-1]
MRRATTPVAATAALRGLLALLVAVVGLLCLLDRPAPPDVGPSDLMSVAQAATAAQPSAGDDSATCGKNPVAAEDVAPRSDTAAGAGPASGSPRWTDGTAPATGSGASFCRGDPAPPHPVTTFSVLRM